LCSPQRLLRPWEGQKEKSEKDHTLDAHEQYDAQCKLCPGNQRASNLKNDNYTSTFIFANDFPAIFPPSNDTNFNTNDEGSSHQDLFISEKADGLCKVICFSPKHNLTLPELEHHEVRALIDVWAKQYEEMRQLPFLKYVTIFENKGAVMGCSNPHPHCQIWATSFIPDDPHREIESIRNYRRSHNGACLLCDYVPEEIKKNERVICSNKSFVAVVPYWAVWPFEVLLVSLAHHSALCTLNDGEREDLATILQQITCKYDNVFETSFPYSMGIHQAPFIENEADRDVHLHFHFYPPLLRSATVKKFMVGFEMLANPQRDLTAEVAAKQLREMEAVHYKTKK